ncbi:caspase family protein [Meridianimarinicoccus sp. RP-17]
MADLRMRILPALAVLFAGLTAAAAAAQDAAQRIALIVGNSAYQGVTQLDNPATDARDMAATLRETGFDVTLLLDADQRALNTAIAQFGRDLRDAGRDATGLFYYAGHGVQSFGTNFLVPVDAALKNAADLSLVGVPAEAVLRQMQSARNTTNIVILDACRDNPFDAVPDMNDNGLAEMKAPTGTYLAYSTAPGSVALDGLDGNSPFTKALLTHIPRPGLPIEQLFKQVRVDVLEETGGRQVPWDASSLTNAFAFVPDEPAPPPKSDAELAWDAVRDTGDPLQILLFLRAFPDSPFAGAAREMINALMVAELSPPAPSAEAAAPPAPAPAQPQSVSPSATPPPTAPQDAERELIETARTSGAAADYQAYLDAFPAGTYAELAAFELALLREKAAEDAGDTVIAALPNGDRALQIAPDAADAPPGLVAPTGLVTFDGPLETGGPGIAGESIATLIEGSPTFPPIEGLPESLWKDATCASCHQWTPDALCTQAKTYLGQNAPALAKSHPLGGGLKHNLRYWAEGGCQ